MLDVATLLIMCLCVCSGLSVAFLAYSYVETDNVPFMHGFWDVFRSSPPPPPPMSPPKSKSTPTPTGAAAWCDVPNSRCWANVPLLKGVNCDQARQKIQADVGEGGYARVLMPTEPSHTDLRWNRFTVLCDSPNHNAGNVLGVSVG